MAGGLSQLFALGERVKLGSCFDPVRRKPKWEVRQSLAPVHEERAGFG